MTKIHALVLGVLVLALTACGDDGGDGNGGGAGNGGVAGVPAETPLSDLTDSQRTSLCSELTSQVNAFAANASGRKGVCLGLAIEGASAEADPAMACDTMLAECEMGLTEELIKEIGGPTSQEICTGAVPAGCTATVGDFASCAQEALDVVVMLGTNHTCESLLGGGAAPDVSARCNTLLDACGGEDL